MQPVLQTVILSAVQATAASDGWIVAGPLDRLEIVAAAGDCAEALLGGDGRQGSGQARYVTQSGQPIALSLRGDTEVAPSVRLLTGRDPTSILSVPCIAGGDVVGALELVDKAGGERFSYDDLELASLLAGIAASAMGGGPADSAPGSDSVPDPDTLAASISSLAAQDPIRYRTVAAMISVLVEHG